MKKIKEYALLREGFTRILRIMKISMFILLVSVVHIFATNSYSQTNKFSLKMENATYNEVFEQLEKETGYYFILKYDQAILDKRVDIQYQKVGITEILDDLLKNTSLAYKFVDKYIAIAPAVELIANAQQQKTITGTVSDKTGQRLPGVTVVIKETTLGTITDTEGNYSLLNVPGDATLVYSFVGMKTQEISVSGKTTIDIILVEETFGIEEVVAIGYGTMKKSDLTGAVGFVKSEKLTRLAPTQTIEAIRGNVAGVQITQTDGKIGSGFSMIIRGMSSIGKSNAPLVVIDGVMGGDLNTLHPNDIENIDILKDASATAIYGSKGANGVIIVTLKKGKKGRLNITYDGNYGFTTPVNIPDYMTPEELIALDEVQHSVYGWSPVYRSEEEKENIANKDYFDFLDAYLHTGNGVKTSHNIALSGGGEKSTHYFSVGYVNQEGNIKPEAYERANIRASIDTKISDKLNAGFSSYFTYNVRDAGSRDALQAAFRLRSTLSPYDPETGELTMSPSGVANFGNPLMEVDDYTDEYRIQDFIGTAYIEYKPYKNISFRSSLSAESNTQRQGQYKGMNTKSIRQRQSRTQAYNSNRQTGSYNWDNIINYDWKKESHKLNLTAINSIAHARFESSYLTVRDFAVKYLWYAMENGSNVRNYGSDFWEWSLVSYMARANYSYKDKYLLTLTSRWDGSSKLAEGHKWDFFPSVAFAWRASEEPFLKESNTFSNLKFRFSYGEVGNDDIAPYTTQSLIFATTYNLNSNLIGFSPSIIANSELGWEHSKEFNLGVDMGLLNHRISVSAELYNRKTDGLIVNRGIPTSTGYNSINGNFAKTQNKGIELTLNTINISTDDFTWTTDINFATNKNKILALAEEGLTQMESNDEIASRGGSSYYREYIVGEDILSHYFYEFDGIFQTGEETSALAQSMYGSSAEPGWSKIKDQNGDGQITVADKKVLGTESPSWTGGMTNTFTYKNFDLSFFLYTVQDVFLFDGAWMEFGDMMADEVKRLGCFDYWTPTNPSNTWSSPSANTQNPYEWAKYFHNISWVRLQNVTLGYSLPKSILSSLGINKLRFYATANNPILFSDYKGKGFDPEWAKNGGNNPQGISTATYIFGLNVTF